eukprot:PLAT6225.1.p1 GENE.PLAT6225.1~~PLAT6225.1.p1  ORF type:complete len:495 (-),score=181.05 PLAT6225.1:136-1563(-)
MTDALSPPTSLPPHALPASGAGSLMELDLERELLSDDVLALLADDELTSTDCPSSPASDGVVDMLPAMPPLTTRVAPRAVSSAVAAAAAAAHVASLEAGASSLLSKLPSRRLPLPVPPAALPAGLPHAAMPALLAADEAAGARRGHKRSSSDSLISPPPPLPYMRVAPPTAGLAGYAPVPLAPAAAAVVAPAGAPAGSKRSAAEAAGGAESSGGPRRKKRKEMSEEDRRRKNRESANRSRLKKKQKMAELEKNVKELDAEVHSLRAALSASEAENKTLRGQVAFLQGLVAAHVGHPGAAAAAAAVASASSDGDLSSAPSSPHMPGKEPMISPPASPPYFGELSMRRGAVLLAVVFSFALLANPGSLLPASGNALGEDAVRSGGRVILCDGCAPEVPSSPSIFSSLMLVLYVQALLIKTFVTSALKLLLWALWKWRTPLIAVNTVVLAAVAGIWLFRRRRAPWLPRFAKHIGGKVA